MLFVKKKKKIHAEKKQLSYMLNCDFNELKIRNVFFFSERFDYDTFDLKKKCTKLFYETKILKN